MNSEIVRRLQQPSESWSPEGPVSPSDLVLLTRTFPFPLPRDYLDLLSICDGGEGELALPPMWLLLWSAKEVAQMALNDVLWPGLFAFASNGGLETIAFDMRRREPWPIVMLDAIAGEDSIEVIADNLGPFVAAIGKVYEDPNV